MAEVGKRTLKIEVDTTELDSALEKLDQAAKKAKELKELLNDITQVNQIFCVQAQEDVNDKVLRSRLKASGLIL
jgi:ABC-type phosphate/phosphonate transport system ATPase subunit